jgi:uncharacterized protein YceH (UPF0502 family)
MFEPLSAEAIRVLGVLIEKELATPDYYPMTVNAVRNGCNQKSNRDPVVAFEVSEVTDALAELTRRHLVGRASGAGSRAAKYRHALAEQLHLNREQRAALATLMLRGPQTPGEIRSRSERMASMTAIEDTVAVLMTLMHLDEPLVTELPLQPGRKEARFTHRLGQLQLDESDSATAPSNAVAAPTSLRSELEVLRDRVDALESQFARFRSQFE